MSDVYPLGQPVRLTTSVVDIVGSAADPTALTLTITLTGGASTTVHWPTPAEITRDSVGQFHYDHTAAAAGHYAYAWVATGTAAGVDVDVFDVTAAAAPRLVSFADAKAFLRLSGVADDALLDRVIGWASARIMREVVAVPITVTETVTARGGLLRLGRRPVRAVTAITGLGLNPVQIQPVNLLVVDPLAGVVGADTGPAPCGGYTVTYTAGHDEIPPGVDGATLALIRHWWNQSQAHGSSTYGDAGFVPDFDELPNVVRNMLRAAPRPPLVA